MLGVSDGAAAAMEPAPLLKAAVPEALSKGVDEAPLQSPITPAAKFEDIVQK